MISDDAIALNWNDEIVDSEDDVGSYSSITLDSNNYPHISYYDNDHEDLMYVKWTGSAWEKERVDMGDVVATYTAIALDSNEWPHIVYVDSVGYKYAKWTGSAWSIQLIYSYTPTAPPWPLQYPKSHITVDGGDYAHIIFGDTYKYWNNTGSYGTALPINITSSTQFVFDSDCILHLSYQYSDYQDMNYTQWNGIGWNDTSVDTYGKVNGGEIALDSQERPYIIYSNESGYKCAKWDGSNWNKEMLDSEYNLIGDIFFLDDNDIPQIYSYTWASTVIPFPAVFSYNITYITGGNGDWSEETIYGEGDLVYPSLAIDSSDQYHISYYKSNSLYYSRSLPPTIPSKPLNLQSTPGDGSINITWSPPDDDGGKVITNYKVYRGTTTGALSLLTTIGNILYFNDTGVTFNQTYFYQVSAVNSIGEGSLSDQTNATLVSPIYLPSVPLNLQATAGDSLIILDWSAPTSDGDAGISNYKIYRGTATGSLILLTTIENTLTYTDNSATNGQIYYYQVSAVNSVGEGSKSNEASATPSSEISTPSAPLNLQATAGDSQVILDWSTPTSDGGASITNYKIYRGTTTGSLTLLATIGNLLTYIDTSAVNDQTYYYKVSAVNSVGEGAESSEVSATPIGGITIPSAPQNLQATAGDGQVTLTWAVPSSDGGSNIINYMVYRGTSAGGETLLATIGNVLTYADTSVTNNQTYYYKVTAVNGVGEGAYSNEITATPSATIDDVDDSTDTGDDDASSIFVPIIALISIIIAIGGVIFALKRKPKTPEPPTEQIPPPPPEN